MARDSNDTFVVEFPLVVEDQTHWRLSKAIELERMIYNATLDTVLNRLKQMKADSAWKQAGKIKNKALRNQRFRDLRKKYGLSLNESRTIAHDHYKGMKRDDLGSHEVQSVGARVWRAVERYMYRKGGKPRFKSSERSFNTISGTCPSDIIFNIADLGPNGPQLSPASNGTNKDVFPHEDVRGKDHKTFLVTGVNYKPTKVKPTCHCIPMHPKPALPMVYWRGLYIPYTFEMTPWLHAALCKDPNGAFTPDNFKKVKYSTFVRRYLNGKERWFVQVSLAGKPPVCHPRAPLSAEMGIDPSTRKIAYFSETEAAIVEVAPNVDMMTDELRLLQRKMERSRRSTNPNNYNADGTIKEGALDWIYSNRYGKLRESFNEIHRIIAATRKRDHGTLINHLLAVAGTIKIEKNSFRAFQRIFGRSINRSGIGEFFEHLKRSAASAGLQVIELDAYALKMSQYDPETDTYTKKPLKQRWHQWGNTDIWVQRDIMSAFLACYVTDKGHNRALLLAKWSAAEALLCVSGLCRQQTKPTLYDRELTASKDVEGSPTHEPLVEMRIKAEGTEKGSNANS